MDRTLCRHGTPTELCCEQCENVSVKWVVVDVDHQRGVISDFGIFAARTQEEVVSKAQWLWNTDNKYFVVRPLSDLPDDWSYYL